MRGRIGAALAMRGGNAVLHVFRGGGAERAKVPDRSRLLAIDGESVRGQDAEPSPPDSGARLGLRFARRVVPPDGGREELHGLAGGVHSWTWSWFARNAARGAHPRFRQGPDPPGHARHTGISGQNRVGERHGPGYHRPARRAPAATCTRPLTWPDFFVPPGTVLGAIRGRDGYVMEIRSPGGLKYSMPLMLLVGPRRPVRPKFSPASAPARPCPACGTNDLWQMLNFISMRQDSSKYSTEVRRSMAGASFRRR